MRLARFSRGHFIGGDLGLPTGRVGTSATPSEVPMGYFWATKKVRSEVTRDFRPLSEVSIMDRKFRSWIGSSDELKNSPKGIIFGDEF